MAFVNEFVSPEDFEKYGFKELNKKYRMLDDETNWTVNKEQDIYIRRIPWMAPSPGFERFHVYWKGVYFFIYIEYDNDSAIILKKLELPQELSSKRSEIINTLREAFSIFGDDGVYTSSENKRAIVRF